ncbi:MAG: hypothetical protein IKO72_00080 [Kiritimatiellae bacterium]|nr:hypothetical protein [Kiritimatiellia bacterium]
MQADTQQFNFWYAVRNTRIVRAPARALETFGETLVNYHLVAELEDDPGKVRIREGRLEAHKPAIITPEAYVQDQMEGFGEQARQYLDFLKQHEDSIRILQYGYRLRQEAFSEQVVTDSIDAVLDRVVECVKAADDPFATVIRGVDEPWDVCLVHFFWLHANASAPVNVRDFEKAHAQAAMEATAPALREDVERAFARAESNPSLVRELGAYLQKQGVFEHYQDRFFKLVRRR